MEAQINVDNVISRKLAESVGMELEGIRKGFIFENEEWVDHVIYSIRRKTEMKQGIKLFQEER